MESKSSGGKRDAGRPEPVLFYRDYMGSAAWELRKKQYYERHAKACKICGATFNVQLNHIKYGDYGREQDRDLVPLCGDHHQALHDKIGVRGNMRYQTRHFLDDMIAQWDAQHEKPVGVVQQPKSPRPRSFESLLEKAASPVWKLLNIMSLRK